MTALPEPLITVSPEYLGGEPVFTGTRVPVQALFDYVEGGPAGLRFQQRLHGRPFAVILLPARTNRLEHLEPLVPG